MCFNFPHVIVFDGEGTIVVADTCNHRLRKIVDGQVTTLAGSSDPGTTDDVGAGARFNQTYTLVLDERGRLLVSELDGVCLRSGANISGVCCCCDLLSLE